MSRAMRKAVLSAAVAAALAGGADVALAVDNLWTGATSNNWNDPTNWSLGRVPTNANGAASGDTFDDAIVSTLNNFPVINTNLSAVPRDIAVGSGAGTTGRVDQTAGTVANGNGNWSYVGRDGATGTYNLADTAASGGTLTHFGTGSGNINVGGRLYVGGTEFGAGGAVGTLNINTTGTLAVNSDLAVGTDASTGVVNMDAGSVTTGGWNFIGKRQNADGGNAMLNMSGGSINNGGGRTYVSYGNSTGQLNMTGGTYANTGDFFSVGNNNAAAAAPGSVSLTGSATLNSGLFIIGGANDNNNAGKGTVTVGGASAKLNVGGELWVGQSAGSTGMLTVNTGGAVSVGNWLAVGRSGATGTVNLNGGTITKTGGNGNHVIIGSIGGNGTLNQSGGDLNTVGNGNIRLGEGTSTALWDFSGGTAETDAVDVGWSGGSNELRVRGTANLTAGSVTVGENNNNANTNSTNTSVVNQSAGTVTSNSWIAVGNGANTLSTYNMSGGTMVAGGLEAGADTAGLITVSNASAATPTVVNVSGNIEVPSRNGAGNLTVTGGTVNGASLLLGGRDGNTAGSGQVNQSGGLVKVTGDVIVQRPNVGTGSYALSGGTLSVDGTLNTTLGTFTFTGGRITRSNAGPVNIAGDLTVGDRAAGFTLGTTKTFAVSGALDISNGITLDVTGMSLPTSTPPTHVTGFFPLGTDGSIVGTFDPSTTSLVGLTTNGATFISESLGEAGTYNHNQSVYWVQENAGAVTLNYDVVPEPGSLGLLALAGVGLIARRSRR